MQEMDSKGNPVVRGLDRGNVSVSGERRNDAVLITQEEITSLTERVKELTKTMDDAGKRVFSTLFAAKGTKPLETNELNKAISSLMWQAEAFCRSLDSVG